MTGLSLYNHTVYDDALLGEPFTVGLPKPLINATNKIWTLLDWQIDVPDDVVQPALDVVRSVGDLRAWTGWSYRQLADVLGTSHTTVRAIEDGRPMAESRSGDLAARIADAREVVSRIFVVAGREPGGTHTLLSTSTDGRRSAMDELADRNPAAAYLAAIDARRPRARGMVVGTRPRARSATAALHQ
jgi:transcriptional regulator with XRE-family HTH domain